jgi:dTDP-4-amino-4,6-dideoxygalactose transaminase
MHTVPFYKPSISTDEIVTTLKSGWLTTGPKTKQFETEFAEYLKSKHAVAVNSCTAALHLALEAIGLKAGQTVVVPTMTFAATAEVVRYFHATPLLADCRAEDFNIDVADAEAKIRAALAQGQSVAAILPVHYGGQVGDAVGVLNLAERYELKVIEDAAHCCPAYFRSTASEPWRTVGSTADISCYSFYANKCITTGEGGMACTQRDDYAERMRIMSLHGISKDAWKRFTAEGSWYYEIVAPGFKYNLTDIAASIGIHQLRKADAMHRKRAKGAELYSQLLGDVEELVLPRQQSNRVHSWHLFVVRLKLDRLKIDRAQFITELQGRGVGTSVHWMPLHMHPYYRETYGYAPQDLPTAASLYPELISLPLYPDMSEQDVGYVCDSVKQILSLNLRPTFARS